MLSIVFILIVAILAAAEDFVYMGSGACSICQDRGGACENGTLLPYTFLETDECMPSTEDCLLECMRHPKCVGASQILEWGCYLNGWVGTSDFRSSYSVGDMIGSCKISSTFHNKGHISVTESEGEGKIVYDSFLAPAYALNCYTLEKWAGDRLTMSPTMSPSIAPTVPPSMAPSTFANPDDTNTAIEKSPSSSGSQDGFTDPIFRISIIIIGIVAFIAMIYMTCIMYQRSKTPPMHPMEVEV